MNLEPVDVYYLACFQAHLDGKLEEDEAALLRALSRGFGLAPGEADDVLARARAAAVKGEAPPDRLERHELFARACRMAWLDGELDEDERGLLLRLAGMLKVPHEDAARVLDEARKALG